MQIDRRAMLSGLGAGLLLPGCATFRGRPSLVNAPSFASLLAHLKHDVATWKLEREGQPGPGGLACGDAARLTLRKLKLSVTASRSGGASATGGLTVPINLLTVGASASRSRAVENSITVGLTLYPSEGNVPLTSIPPASEEFEGTPISDALAQLRRDLWRSAAAPPCFDFNSDGAVADDKQDNAVKWAFTVKDNSEAGVKFSLLFFTIGGGASQSQSYANTIEATFSGAGAAAIPP